MMNTHALRGPAWRSGAGLFCLIAHAILSASLVAADPAPRSTPVLGWSPAAHPMSLDAAIRWALDNNPELAALRQQRGIAAARVLTAQTYPFNPVWEGRVRNATGPASAGITNRVPTEHSILLETELRGQGRYRVQGANAGASRTDNEVAFQEVSLVMRVVRAFDAVLYRREKLRLAENTVHLNEQAADQVSKLVAGAKLRPADLILARTETDDASTQVVTGRTALTSARQELRRLLGVVHEEFEPEGSLAVPDERWDAAALTERALEQRPDLRARQAAVDEAEARVRLAVADRYGNPNVGINYEYDNTRTNMFGLQFSIPLPLLNKRRGEILERQGERDRAVLELRQAEIEVRQAVRAALNRLDEARAAVALYTTRILPNLETNVQGMERLLAQADPGVDLLRVIDVRRKLLRAREGSADALWEQRQALVELAAALGSPALALSGSEPTPEPVLEPLPVR